MRSALQSKQTRQSTPLLLRGRPMWPLSNCCCCRCLPLPVLFLRQRLPTPPLHITTLAKLTTAAAAAAAAMAMAAATATAHIRAARWFLRTSHAIGARTARRRVWRRIVPCCALSIRCDARTAEVAGAAAAVAAVAAGAAAAAARRFAFLCQELAPAGSRGSSPAVATASRPTTPRRRCSSPPALSLHVPRVSTTAPPGVRRRGQALTTMRSARTGGGGGGARP